MNCQRKTTKTGTSSLAYPLGSEAAEATASPDSLTQQNRPLVSGVASNVELLFERSKCTFLGQI